MKWEEKKKDRLLEYLKGKYNEKKLWVNKGNFLSPLVVSTLYLISEAKIITLADMVFKVCRENISLQMKEDKET